MLVVSRRAGQGLMIGRSKEAIAAGEFIEVRITEIRGNQCKLGIDATGDVKLYRDDVFAEWCEQNNIIPCSEPVSPIFGAA